MLSATKVVLLLLPRRRLAPRPNESDFNRPEERGDASEGAGAVPVDGGSTAITRSGGSSATDDDGITTLFAALAGLYSRLATYPV